MSVYLHLQNINQAFDRIAEWYKEFMHRTELNFQAMNKRILRLEERQITQGPSDAQVERILRKILAERFSSHDFQRPQGASSANRDGYFVEKSENLSWSRPINIDAAQLNVDPEAVPSKAYVETFNMLEQRLKNFPDVNPDWSQDEDDEDTRPSVHVRTPQSTRST